MHKSIKNLEDINKELKLEIKEDSLPNIIAVSKTFSLPEIMPLVDYGHIHFGENKVQEAIAKWTEIKVKYPTIKLHLIGKLQTNKVKYAVKLFDYLHSVDNEKLAKKISDEQLKHEKKLKIFIQVNIGDENQKSGVNQDGLEDFYSYCTKLNLNIIGLMCIPPINKDPNNLFKKLHDLNKKLNLKELSMGMSADYIEATKNFSTYLRIGSKIFGTRN